MEGGKDGRIVGWKEGRKERMKVGWNNHQNQTALSPRKEGRDVKEGRKEGP